MSYNTNYRILILHIGNNSKKFERLTIVKFYIGKFSKILKYIQKYGIYIINNNKLAKFIIFVSSQFFWV